MGSTAALIEKESSGVCSLSLGNLSPWVTCEITIKSIQEVKTLKGTRGGDGNNTTDICAIIPSLYDKDLRMNVSSNYSQIDVSFHMNHLARVGTKIVDMRSTSHEEGFKVLERGDLAWTACSELVTMKSDYEVVVTLEDYPDSIWFRSVIEEESEGEEEEEKEKEQKKQELYMDFVTFKLSDDEKYLDNEMNENEKEEEEELDEKLFLEIVFIPDRSGSMSGGRMKKAVEAMKLCFQSLDIEQEIYFNIVSFGSNYKYMFPKSRRLDEVRYKEVMNSLTEMNASMGGTDIFTPLTKVLNEPKLEVCSRRVVFLLTDGEDGRTNDILSRKL